MSSKTVIGIVLALFVCLLLVVAYDQGGSSIILEQAEAECNKLGHETYEIEWHKFWFWKDDYTITCITTTVNELELK